MFNLYIFSLNQLCMYACTSECAAKCLRMHIYSIYLLPEAICLVISWIL